MFKSLSKKIAVDLGSSKIRIIAVDQFKNEVWELSPVDFRQNVLEEDACLARRKDNHKLLAVGKEALEMRGRVEGFAEIVFPFQNSRVLDKKAATTLLKELLKRVFNGLILNPSVIVTTSASATDFERQVLSQLFYELGFSKVSLIAAPLAAAIGAGVPVADSSGTLFLQMGASGVQAGAIALGSLLFSEDSYLGGDRLNQEIVDHLAARENFAISIESAELLKKEVLSLVHNKKSLSITGKTINGANPLELKIKNENLEPIIELIKFEYESLIKALFAKLPPDLIKDALAKGILLSGGLAKIQGLEEFLSERFSLPVALLDEPDLLASMGATAMMKNLDLFGGSLAFDF